MDVCDNCYFYMEQVRKELVDVFIEPVSHPEYFIYHPALMASIHTLVLYHIISSV